LAARIAIVGLDCSATAFARPPLRARPDRSSGPSGSYRSRSGFGDTIEHVFVLRAHAALWRERVSRMAECFCGCGQSVSFSHRSPNAMGRRMARELEQWEELQELFEQSGRWTDNIEAFMDDGEWLYANLQSLVHNGRVDAGFSNRRSRSGCGSLAAPWPTSGGTCSTRRSPTRRSSRAKSPTASRGQRRKRQFLIAFLSALPRRGRWLPARWVRRRAARGGHSRRDRRLRRLRRKARYGGVFVCSGGASRPEPCTEARPRRPWHPHFPKSGRSPDLSTRAGPYESLS
jgi:hypothetical protein